jgi:alginate O-acetyltransferase complex protein AlgI
MVFSDLFFLFVFLPAFALSYLAAHWIDQLLSSENSRPNRIVENAVLVVFSLIFYAWGEPVYVFLMLFCVLLNYLAGLGIGHTQGTARKWALAGGLTGNILILSTFKYLSFFAQQLTALGIPVADPKIALPIGISFYTFQSISYLIDVYRQEAPMQRHFGNLLLYISMFPQLIAGPIVRYNTVAQEISNRSVTSKDVADGIYRFVIGLGKKVILANQLSEISDQFLAGNMQDLTTTGAWTGIVAFTLQIYFDFSGYSDMAIGLGRCLGFHFNENFRHPYCCDTITDFWRRWHISLGSFFRDYVYIPMGGNRSHQALNILVVWFLTGMWHGASWNFIIWGVYFGLIVTIEKYTILRIRAYIPSPLLHLYSLVLVVIGWGIFYFDDSSRMARFFEICFGQGTVIHDYITISALADNCWLWVVCLLFCMPLRSGVGMLLRRHTPKGGLVQESILLTGRLILSIVLLILSVALLVGATNNAFIYTRF